MRKHYWYVTLAFVFMNIFFSCQKEFSIDGDLTLPNALTRGNAGQCLPINVGGTYLMGKDLGDTNFIDVEVAVHTVGSYAISTGTVNGYSFSGTGTFADTGKVSVRLTGTGTPTAAGTNNFTVTLGGTSCGVNITVQTPPVGPATYTLDGDPASCISANVQGAYVTSAALDSNSFLQVNVNVSTPGTFSIATNTVNGYSFSASGFFTTTGTQIVTLKGTGIPISAGVDGFTLSGNSSSCTIPVTVTSGYQPIANNDYFPLTYQSYWHYSDIWNPGFTIKRDVSDSTMINNQLYKIMEEQNPVTGDNQQFYRKNGYNYYEYISVDKYTASVKFTPQIKNDLLFLKEDAVTGTSWESPADTGIIIGGQSVVLKYAFRCIAANVSKTIQGKSYQSVIVIQVRPQVRSLTDAWGETGEITDLYFAKGVGLIYAYTIANSFIKLHWELSNYMVN